MAFLIPSIFIRLSLFFAAFIWVILRATLSWTIIGLNLRVFLKKYVDDAIPYHSNMKYSKISAYFPRVLLSFLLTQQQQSWERNCARRNCSMTDEVLLRLITILIERHVRLGPIQQIKHSSNTIPKTSCSVCLVVTFKKQPFWLYVSRMCSILIQESMIIIIEWVLNCIRRIILLLGGCVFFPKNFHYLLGFLPTIFISTRIFCWDLWKAFKKFFSCVSKKSGGGRKRALAFYPQNDLHFDSLTQFGRQNNDDKKFSINHSHTSLPLFNYETFDFFKDPLV